MITYIISLSISIFLISKSLTTNLRSLNPSIFSSYYNLFSKNRILRFFKRLCLRFSIFLKVTGVDKRKLKIEKISLKNYSSFNSKALIILSKSATSKKNSADKLELINDFKQAKPATRIASLADRSRSGKR